MANPHPNIIQFYGLTKLRDEKYYSLVLEYAEVGTLGKYLRDDTISFKWGNQLRFAKEIASAISWFHDDVGIIHGDLHPNNILISKGTIKLADFGCSCLKGSNRNILVQGVIPYVDPKCFETHSYRMTEKSDIYSLGVLFWELTSRKSPFDFETEGDHSSIKMIIRNGVREKPVKDTNDKFVALYKKCWQHKPDDRLNIQQVISELNLISRENNNVSTTFTPEKSEANEDLYLSD